jgi:Putative transposase/Transposase zinc-binding domain
LESLPYGYFTARHSPLGKTPHKQDNGELTITCRNRHCPKCQGNARELWLQARGRELLPTRYVHVVFTLPRELAPLTLQNKKIVYDLLFKASADTLLAIARNPKYLGAEIGFFSVLHSWNQKLEFHPHIHCVVPAGGLSTDRGRWVATHPKFFLPLEALAKVFRGKFTDALKEAFANGHLGFYGTLKPLGRPKVFAQLLQQIHREKWVVYAKPPFGGPLHVLRYLGRYTHRVAISNHRLISFADDQVTFRWRDSAHQNKQRLMTLPVYEFLRRFLLHVLPPGFVRIRHFGFLSTRKRSSLLPLCFRLLAEATPSNQARPAQAKQKLRTVATTRLCPTCTGPMILIESRTALQPLFRSPPGALTTTA